MTVAVTDQGAGEPLVLLHGLGANRRIWDSVIPHLAGGHRLLAIDTPGFGQSPPLPGRFGLASPADAVCARAAELAGGSFDLVGHSLGGAIAVTAAGRHPELVRTLVLCSPAGLRPRPERVAQALAAGAQAFYALRRSVGARFAHNPRVRRVFLKGALADPDAVSVEQARSMLASSRGARALGAAAHAAVSADLEDDVIELPMPVGLLWGESDTVFPLATTRALIHRRPRIELKTIPGAGHVAQVDRPAEFAAALEQLLDSLREQDIRPAPAR